MGSIRSRMRAAPVRPAACTLLAAVALLAAAPAPSLPPAESVYEKDVRFALRELEARCGHFFQTKGIDWKRVTREMLREARGVKTDQEHLVLLVRLLARLRDGHAAVRPLEKGQGVEWPADKAAGGRGGQGGQGGRGGPGMFLCRAGKKIYVKNAWSAAAAAGIRPGWELVKVDGTPARKWIEDRVRKLSDTHSFSTDQQAFFYACHWGLAEPRGTRMSLELRDPRGKRKKTTLTLGRASVVPRGPAFPPDGLETTGDLFHGKTGKGWGYIHVRRCPGDLPEQMDRALEALANPPGLILDFRGNSGGGFDHEAFLGRFVPEGKTLRFGGGGIAYPSAGPHPYGGPVVVIVDATVRSAGETASGIFKEDGRGYMIGESPTAGMSSSKTTIELPSGLFSLYVSIRSNKHRFNGGRGIEGIGVIPHEIVAFDPRDLADGRDTLIARAEDLLAHRPWRKVPYDPRKFGWKP